MKIFQTLSPKTKGILWILSTKFSFVVMMSIVKQFLIYPSLQMNFIRSVLVMAVVLPILIKKGKQAFLTKWPLYQLIRVVLGATAMISFFYAYRVLSMAKASALNFSLALVLPFMAILFLKEKVTWQRWAVILLGYLGMWIIIDPVFDKFEWAEGVMLFGVVCLAGDSLQVKKIKTDSPYTMMFYSACATLFLLGLYFLIIPHFPNLQNEFLMPWKSLEAKHIPIFLSLGGIAFFGQYSYVNAYRQNRLNFVAGFDYLKLVFGTIIGLIFFGEIPGWDTLLGGFIILACSYILARQESK
jgi:drug/metabolite transporter (DMT)-like permease